MSLYLLKSNITHTLPKAVAAHGAPVAVGLYSKLLGHRFFSSALDARQKKKVAKPEAQSYPSLWNASFRDVDNFFSRDPFFRDPYVGASLFRQDPWTSIMPVLRNFPRAPGQTLLRSSPGYEINETDGVIQISIDVPDGLGASDIKVDIENGKLLHVSGKRESEKDGSKSVSEFHKRFSIGPNLDVDNVKANFADGTLVLSAPKVEVKEPTLKTIPVAEEPYVMSDEEVLQKSFSDDFDESDWAEAGKTSMAA